MLMVCFFLTPFGASCFSSLFFLECERLADFFLPRECRLDESVPRPAASASESSLLRLLLLLRARFRFRLLFLCLLLCRLLFFPSSSSEHGDLFELDAAILKSEPCVLSA